MRNLGGFGGCGPVLGAPARSTHLREPQPMIVSKPRPLFKGMTAAFNGLEGMTLDRKRPAEHPPRSSKQYSAVVWVDDMLYFICM